MSTILKALRRLEEEKSASGSRPLREEIAKPPFSSGRPPRRGLPVVGLSIAFALALAFGTWWLLPTIAGPAAETGALAQVEPGVPGSVRPTPAERAPDATSVANDGLPAEAFSSPVEVVPRPRVTPRVPIDLSPREAPAVVAEAPEPAAPFAKAAPRPSVVAAAPAPKPRPVSRPAAESKPAPRPSVTPEVAAPPAPERRVPATEERPARVAAVAKPDPPPTPEAVKPAPVEPTPAPVKPTTAAVEPTPARAEPTPVRAEPTPPVVAAAPQIRVDKTLWHPQPDRREAIVGLEGAAARRVQEGDVVGRFVVSEIQPSGVVFESDGTKLRRGIGAE